MRIIKSSFIMMLLGTITLSFSTFTSPILAEELNVTASPLDERRGTDVTSPVLAEELNVTLADETYSKRGEDAENANTAAQMYKELAAIEKDKVAKAELTIKQVRALFYFANNTGDEESGDKKVFKEGAKISDSLVLSLEDPEDSEEEHLKAEALFFYGAHLARTLSFSNLRSATKVVDAMNTIIEDLELEEVYHYGAHRVLSRLRFKLHLENLPDFLMPIEVDMSTVMNGP